MIFVMQELLSLAAEIELDNSALCVHKWVWLKRFATAHRAAHTLCGERDKNPPFSSQFLADVRRKVRLLVFVNEGSEGSSVGRDGFFKSR